MALTVSLTNDFALPRLAVPIPVDWKTIFRSQSVRAGAELFTLIGTAVGLLTLFAGLSLL